MNRLTDYTSHADALAHASSAALWDLFDGDREQLNIAHECINRHADGSGRAAVRIAHSDGADEILRDLAGDGEHGEIFAQQGGEVLVMAAKVLDPRGAEAAEGDGIGLHSGAQAHVDTGRPGLLGLHLGGGEEQAGADQTGLLADHRLQFPERTDHFVDQGFGGLGGAHQRFGVGEGTRRTVGEHHFAAPSWISSN